MDTSLWLPGTNLELFVYKGMTLAVFISPGTTPVFNDRLLMYEIG